jgi:hypothetical protein
MEAASDGHLRKRHRLRPHQMDRSLDSKPHHELVWRQTDGGPEETGKVERADVRTFRQRNQRHIFIEL